MPFQPGQSGNPNGSKNARMFSEAIRLEIAALEDGDYAKGCRRIARKWVKRADEGDQPAIESLVTRMDGKPAQQLIHTGDAENPVRIIAAEPNDEKL